MIRFDPAIHLHSLGIRFAWHYLDNGGRSYTLQGQSIQAGDLIVLPGNDAPGIPGVYDPATFAGLGWERVGHEASALDDVEQLQLQGMDGNGR